jgi:hypothetical protein
LQDQRLAIGVERGVELRETRAGNAPAPCDVEGERRELGYRGPRLGLHAARNASTAAVGAVVVSDLRDQRLRRGEVPAATCAKRLIGSSVTGP